MGHFRGLKRPPNWKICHIFPFFGQIRAWNMSAWPLMARNRFSAFKRHHKNVLTYYLFAEIGQTSPQNEPILYPTQQKCWILKLFERWCMTAQDGARRRTMAYYGVLQPILILEPNFNFLFYVSIILPNVYNFIAKFL